LTTATPTQTGGETDTSVEHAAERILGLMDAQEPPKTEETQTDSTPEPTPPEGGQPAAKATEEVSEPEGDAQNVDYETLDQLAEATGLPLEKILNLKTKANVDGQESTVPLSEILKSYQLSKHVNDKSQELANQRKAFEADREKQVTEIKQRLIEAQALSQDLEQSLMAEHNSIDWTALRTTDPAEFAAKKQEFNERWNQIQGKKMRATAEAQKFQQEQHEKVKKHIETERAKWRDVVPEWKDDKRFEAERGEIVSYLRGQGISDEDISSLYDSRQIKIIRNAMLYEKSSKAATIAQKKVALLPKVLKPGTQTTKSDSRTEKDKELSTRLRKSGRLEDAAALIESRMK
jgi:hypothetical protein